MPACFRPNKKDQGHQQGPEDAPEVIWREPPGYLGEAVRRAKLIPSRASKLVQTPPQTKA